MKQSEAFGENRYRDLKDIWRANRSLSWPACSAGPDESGRL